MSSRTAEKDRAADLPADQNGAGTGASAAGAPRCPSISIEEGPSAAESGRDVASVNGRIAG
jgi:hypothetical protein